MLKQETFYEVQSWGCVSALLGLPAELIPHKIQEANLLDGVFCWELIVAGLSDWGCVLIPTGLPAELIPHSWCAVPDDVYYYTSQKESCQ